MSTFKLKQNKFKAGIERQKKVQRISDIISKTLDKMFIFGDKDHEPVSVHLSDFMNMLDSDDSLVVGKILTNFMFGELHDWTVFIYHYFQNNDFIEVVPVVIELNATTLNKIGDTITELCNKSKEELFKDPEKAGYEDKYKTYSYDIHWGTGFDLDVMNCNYPDNFLKISQDLSFVKVDHEVKVTGDMIIKQIVNDKSNLKNPLPSSESEFISMESLKALQAKLISNTIKDFIKCWKVYNNKETLSDEDAVKEINRGDCGLASIAIHYLLKRKYSIETTIMVNPFHGWISYHEKDYDTTHPEGICEGEIHKVWKNNNDDDFVKSVSFQEACDIWMPYDTFGGYLVKGFLNRHGVALSTELLHLIDNIAEYDNIEMKPDYEARVVKLAVNNKE